MAHYRARASAAKPDLADQERRVAELRRKIASAAIEGSKLDHWLDSLDARGGGRGLRRKRRKKALAVALQAELRREGAAKDHAALHDEFDVAASSCDPDERRLCSSQHLILRAHFQFCVTLGLAATDGLEQVVRELSATKKLKTDGYLLDRAEVVRRLRHAGLTHSEIALLLCLRNDDAAGIQTRLIDRVRLDSMAAVVRKALSDGKGSWKLSAASGRVVGKKYPARPGFRLKRQPLPQSCPRLSWLSSTLWWDGVSLGQRLAILRLILDFDKIFHRDVELAGQSEQRVERWISSATLER